MDIELSDQDIERLQLLAKMKGVAVEDVVIEAISEYLGQLEGVVAGLDIQQALIEADAGDFAADSIVDACFKRLLQPEGVCTMRQIKFECVPIGAEFKESAGGVWYLKVDQKRGLWRANGMESTPTFPPCELVWVECTGLTGAAGA